VYYVPVGVDGVDYVPVGVEGVAHVREGVKGVATVASGGRGEAMTAGAVPCCADAVLTKRARKRSLLRKLRKGRGEKKTTNGCGGVDG